MGGRLDRVSPYRSKLSTMRKIFESSDSMRVRHYQSRLESDGIQTFVKNLN